MKTKNLFAFALIAGLTFSACSNDDEMVDMSNEIVQINASISETTPKLKASIDPYTGTGFFDNNDIWGLYATVNGNHVLNNSIYTVGSTTIYWNNLSDAFPVTFAAHYPRMSTIANPEAYVFNAATATNPDLLVTAPVTKSKGDNVDLTFNHVMHQLVINISKDPGIPGDLLDTEMTLLNMKSLAKVNLLTGTVDVAAASGTDNYPMKTGGAIWLVAPQRLTAGAEWIQLQLEGKTYKFRVPADLTQLESGKRVSMTLNLKAGGDAVMLNRVISGWVNQQPEIYDDVIGN